MAGDNKCSSCGGAVKQDGDSLICEYCGTIVTVPTQNDPSTILLERNIATLFQATNPDDKKKAIKALAKNGSQVAIDALIQSIDVNNFYYIGQALAQIGEKAIPAVAVFLNDCYANVRWRAIDIFTEMGPKAKSMAPVLETLFGDDEDVENKYDILKALGSIGNESSIPLLSIVALDKRFGERMRGCALCAMKQMATLIPAETLKRLISILNKEKETIAGTICEILVSLDYTVEKKFFGGYKITPP